MDNKNVSVVSLQIDNIQDNNKKEVEKVPQNIDNKRLSVVSLQTDDFRPKNVRESRTPRPSMISISIADEDEDDDDEMAIKTKRSNSQIKIDTRRLSVASLIADEGMPARKPLPDSKTPNVRESRTQRPSMISITAVEEEYEEHYHAIAQQIDDKRLSVVSLLVNGGENDERELNEKSRSILCDEKLQEEIKAQKVEKLDQRPTGRTSVLISNTSKTSYDASCTPSIVISENFEKDGDIEYHLFSYIETVNEEQANDFEEEKQSDQEKSDDDDDGYKGFKNSLRKSASRESRVSCMSRVSMMSRTSMLSNAGLTSTDACGGAGVPVLNFDLKKAREMAQRSGSVLSISAEEKNAILAKRRKSSNVSVSSRRSIARYKRDQEKRKQLIGTYQDKKDNTMTLLNYDEHINTEKNDQDEEDDNGSTKTRTSVMSQIGKFVGDKFKKGSVMSLFGNGNDDGNNERRNTEDFIRYELEKKQEEEENWRMYNLILGAGTMLCILLVLMRHKYAIPFGFLLFIGLVVNNVSKMGDKLQDKREMRAKRRITHARQSVIGRNSVSQGQSSGQRRTLNKEASRKGERNHNKPRRSLTLSQALSNV